MFLDFFYALRKNGLDVSVGEWMTLMEALQKGLHNQSFTGFYYLARSIVVKSEAEFDKFDQTFAEVFRGVPFEGPVPDEVMEWLKKPKEDLEKNWEEDKLKGIFENQDFADLLRRMEETLRQQDGEHNGGTRWVGTQGRTGYGNSGWFPNGIRIAGKSMHRTAMSVATDREFKDFRTDKMLDTRAYQMAFRKLRAFTTDDPTSRKELDIDKTIDETCNNAGNLKIEYKNPRKNAIKLLIFMDSGGSMDWYANLCNMLFQAATKSNYFKELHTYYFHNCIYEDVYTDPRMRLNDTVSTEWIINQYGPEYKVIIVGDAAMNPYEILEHRYNWKTRSYQKYSGIEWLERLKAHYRYLIWLNPEKLPEGRNFWTQTHLDLAQKFKMYDLSVDGLEQGIKALMARK